MSVLDSALVASPPDIHLTSPPDVPSAEFTHDPYTSSSSFISQGPPASFQLTMPPSKTPRIPGHISPYIGTDGDIEINDDHSYIPSPGRRTRAYPMINQGLVLPHSGYTSTPKNMGIHMGLSHSADPTPSRLNQAYSSPADNSPLHASMRFAGEDSIAGQWELGNAANKHREDDDDPTPVRKPITTTTPTQSPVPSRIGSKRMLSGLGDSPMGSVKRSRFASHGGGSISAHSSVPPSPSRASTLPTASGSARMPLERSISLAAPPFSTQSRQVSGMSMVSSASTELISPSLGPTYEGSFEIMPTFPTSMSAPEMGDLSALASYGSHSNSPIVASFSHATVSPHDVLHPTFATYQTVSGGSVYPSPIPSHTIIPSQPQMTPGTSPSLGNAQPPYYGPLQPGSIPLDTIHEMEHVTEVPAQITPSIHATPTLVVPSQPPSTGAPSTQTVPDGRPIYPQPSFIPITTGTPVTAPMDPPPAKDSNMPEFPPVVTRQFWTGKVTPQAPPPHLVPSFPPHQQRPQPPPHQQPYMAAPAYYPPPPPPVHSQWPQPPLPHAFTQRSVSSDYTYGIPQPYSPYQDGAPSMPSPSTYPSHPSITRSVSTPYMHSHMPMQYPSSGSTPGLYPPPGPASAPMTSSVSLPNAAESSMYIAEQPWNSGGVGLGLGTDQPQQYNWSSNVQHETSAQSTPTTPGRKRHPSVGKRLRPGPRPRLTPKKKGKGKAPSSSVTGDEDFDEPQSVDPSPEISKAPAPSGYYQPRGRYQTNAGSGPSNSKGELELGGPLSASYAGPSHHGYHYPQNQLTAHIIPQEGSSYGAPHLTLDPVIRAGSPDSKERIAVDVIETMYKVVDNPAGPTNGQGHKRFRCLIEGCEREFPRKSAIKSHIQTHLDDKPYKCRTGDCTAGFVRQHDLKRHMKIHSGTKPFKCPCLKEFARGDALRRHQERKLDPKCTGEKASPGNAYPHISGNRSRHRP